MVGLHLIRVVARVIAAVVTCATLAATGYLALTDHQPLVERTASMAPALQPGDLLVVQRRTAAAVGAGDVVRFAHPTVPGRTITHRVVDVAPVGVERLKITTRGDANPTSETWTTPRAGEVGVLEHAVALPPVVVTLLDRTPVRGIALALMCLVGLTVTLRAIWRRSPACAPAV